MLVGKRSYKINCWISPKKKQSQVHYKRRHALASHVSPHVRRKQQNILGMEMHLMRLLPTTFSTDFKCFSSSSHQTALIETGLNH